MAVVPAPMAVSVERGHAVGDGKVSLTRLEVGKTRAVSLRADQDLLTLRVPNGTEETKRDWFDLHQGVRCANRTPVLEQPIPWPENEICEG